MHRTRSKFLPALVLALGLLAVSISPVSAAKDVFIRTKPHVNVGTIQGEPAQIWLHADAGVFGDGDASGILQLRVSDGESFLYRVTGGRFIVERGAVVELMLDLERVGEGGTPTGASDLVIVRPSSAADDCLIYDVLGANVHVEAEGRLSFRHPGAN